MATKEQIKMLKSDFIKILNKAKRNRLGLYGVVFVTEDGKIKHKISID